MRKPQTDGAVRDAKPPEPVILSEDQLDALHFTGMEPETFVVVAGTKDKPGLAVKVRGIQTYEEWQDMGRSIAHRLEARSMDGAKDKHRFHVVDGRRVPLTDRLIDAAETVCAGVVEPRMTFERAVALSQRVGGPFWALRSRIDQLSVPSVDPLIQGEVAAAAAQPFPAGEPAGGAPSEDTPEPGADTE